MQPLEALTYTGSDGNSGGSYALQTGEAFTFQLPQAFTPRTMPTGNSCAPPASPSAYPSPPPTPSPYRCNAPW